MCLSSCLGSLESIPRSSGGPKAQYSLSGYTGQCHRKKKHSNHVTSSFLKQVKQIHLKGVCLESHGDWKGRITCYTVWKLLLPGPQRQKTLGSWTDDSHPFYWLGPLFKRCLNTFLGRGSKILNISVLFKHRRCSLIHVIISEVVMMTGKGANSRTIVADQKQRFVFSSALYPNWYITITN